MEVSEEFIEKVKEKQCDNFGFYQSWLVAEQEKFMEAVPVSEFVYHYFSIAPDFLVSMAE